MAEKTNYRDRMPEVRRVKDPKDILRILESAELAWENAGYLADVVAAAPAHSDAAIRRVGWFLDAVAGEDGLEPLEPLAVGTATHPSPLSPHDGRTSDVSNRLARGRNAVGRVFTSLVTLTSETRNHVPLLYLGLGVVGQASLFASRCTNSRRARSHATNVRDEHALDLFA